ncbi:hypothetical protein F1C10_15815 (plasmid) [Sphingomonas sp. NBWT7]|nr:hypothetical protein F1C10_15815 [Sphingomonas sp. NBWT7]
MPPIFATEPLGVPRESIRVILREIPDANFAVAGVTFAARKTNTLKAAS